MPKMKRYEDTLYNPEWLRRVYVDENRNAAQVAALIGATRGAVLDALRRHGIPVKDASEAQTKAQYHRGSSAPRPRGKFKDTLHNPDWLRLHFEERNLTAAAIARIVGCSTHSAWRAIKQHLGVSTTRDPSPHPEHVLREFRARAKARAKFPNAEPCIVCGNTNGTRNHIDGDPENNDAANIEWLCLRHHLMVDKRLQARAARWMREQLGVVWRQWHDEILAAIKADPNKPARAHWRWKE